MTKLSVPGSPDHEHTRSPAARTVASLAQASGLFLSHFEHRLALPTPPTWTDGERRAPPEFVGGVLSESKYQAFRHDCLVASFHPGHRAKWTAHELCHGLVGFAYQSGSTSLFQAIAAWLAELLPVALWYFFDEAGVQRCADHQWGGPIFQRHCDACEEAAKRGSRRLGPDDRKWMQDGRAFVERELAAIARSRKLGRPQGSLHASIDLASDGLAYAHAHGPRLRAPEMERFVSQFFGPRQGHHPTLESLEARVVELCSALSEGKKAQPWQTTRWDFVAQDLGYRLLTLRAQCEIHGSALDAIIDGLAGQRSRAGVARAIRDYRTLYAAHPRGRARAALFAPEDLFAVGYALPDGMGSSHTQVAQGIGSACPNAFHALGKQRARVVESFCVDDRAERVPLGRRFAAWLARNEPGPIAELARLEAAITHVQPRDPFAAQLEPHEAADGRLRLSRGVEVVSLTHDVLDMSAAGVRKQKRLPAPRVLLVARASDANVDLIELPLEVAEQLSRAGERGVERSELALDEHSVHELCDARWLMPVRYAL